MTMDNNASTSRQAPIQLPPHPNEVQNVVPILQINWDAAKLHARLLDLSATQFLFGSSDDNKERKKLRIEYLRPFVKELKTTSRERLAEIYRRAPGFANQHYLGSIDDPGTQRWIEYWQAQGCGIFITLQEMKGTRRRIVETTRIRTVFADMDKGQKKDWPIPPSFVVETGPGHTHPYWHIRGGVEANDETAAIFSGIMQRIVDDYGADNGAKDLTRVLRLAGTWHLKGAPRQVRIITQSGELPAYSWEELQRAFPPVPRAPKVTRVPRASTPGVPSVWEPRTVDPAKLLEIGEALPFVDMESREDWRDMGMAIHDYTGGSDEGLALWISASWEGEAAECTAQWQTFTPGKGITIDTLFHHAREGGWQVMSPHVAFFHAPPYSNEAPNYDPEKPGHKASAEAYARNWRLPPPVAHAPAAPAVDGFQGAYEGDEAGYARAVAEAIQNRSPMPQRPAGFVPPRVIAATPFRPRHEKQIPPRGFIYGRSYIRGETSGTYAPGGTAKTALVIVEALAMVTRISLLGEKPKLPLRVIFFCEDSRDEIERRFVAAAKRYEIDWDRDVADRLVVHSLRDERLNLVSSNGKAGFQVNSHDIEAVKLLARTHRADVVFFDTMKKIHQVNENDNGEMDALISELNQIAQQCTCSVMLLAHTKKLGLNSGQNIGDGRGASAQIDALRSARLITRMTADEAKKLSITENDARRYVRIGDSKENMAPPADKSEWYVLAKVALDNFDANARDFDGPDEIQVVMRWTPPKITAEFSEATLNDIIEAVDNGVWRESDQAKEWIGYAIANIVGVDLGEFSERVGKKSERGKIRKIINQLIDDGVLVVTDNKDDKGRKRPYIETKSKMDAAGAMNC